MRADRQPLTALSEPLITPCGVTLSGLKPGLSMEPSIEK